MSVAEPVYLILSLPLLWMLWRLPALPSVRWIRAGWVIAIVLALAGPQCERTTDAATLVVIVDRSDSMPSKIEAVALDWIARCERERGSADRLIVIDFAKEARLIHDSSRGESFRGFPSLAARHASDLDKAVSLALSLLAPNAPARAIVFSDGRVPESQARGMAQTAAARRMALDVYWLEREADADVAVRALELPQEVERNAQFSFAAWVHCERARTLTWVLRRDAVELARSEQSMQRGWTRIDLRDRVDHAGIARYEFALEGADDSRPENDRSEGALRVSGPLGLLLLNRSGTAGTLGAALQRLELELTVARPETVDLSAAALRRYRAIVIDGLPIETLGRASETIANFVMRDGGSLLLGGGPESFGLGGYHLSPIDPLLPVSMELVPERREFGLGLICLLDNSGSMSATIDDGRTKLSLAAEGAAAALSLLGPYDAGGAMTVDTQAHTVLELAPMRSRESAVARVKDLPAGSGGIYVHTALTAAADWIESLGGYRRHIVLFADASDAEEQGGVHAWIRAAHEDGITLSVIALGSRSDSDAAFLEECARLGGGGCYFTERAEDLPQLFTRDTLITSARAYIDASTAVEPRAELLQLGALPLDAFPSVPGYNRTILRPNAILGAATLDEDAAPILAWAHSGLGRTAAFLAPLADQAAGSLPAWPAYADLFPLLVRWLVGTEDATMFSAVVAQRNAQIDITVEAEARASLSELSKVRVELRAEDGRSIEASLSKVGPFQWHAQLELPTPGLWLGTVQLADQSSQLPPLVYAATGELDAPVDPAAGRFHLIELAALSNGTLDPLPERAFRHIERAQSLQDLTTWFWWAAWVLFLFEIPRRRLGAAPAVAKLAAPRGASRSQENPHQPAEKAPDASPKLSDALQQARQRAQRRLDRPL